MKKLLYVVGGIVGSLILLGALIPDPTPPPVIQHTPRVLEEATATATDLAELPERVEMSASSAPAQVVSPTPRISPAPAAPPKTSAPAPEYDYYSITKVVDGDTIKIDMNGTEETLRLIGMDTPETVDPRKPVQCFGIEASNKAKELLSGRKVRIEKDPSQGERDKYDRLLAYVYRDDGLFYDKYMIEQGYAHEYTYNLPYKYQSELKAAQKSAQENLRGLWSPDTCNGDTTSGNTTSTESASQANTTTKYYTSSYYSAKYYYPEQCDAWKGLSEKYLESFDTLELLLAKYNRTLSPQCE